MPLHLDTSALSETQVADELFRVIEGGGAFTNPPRGEIHQCPSKRSTPPNTPNSTLSDSCEAHHYFQRPDHIKLSVHDLKA